MGKRIRLSSIARKASRVARLQARIVRHTLLDPETGCRRWTARRNNQGYPVMTMRIKGYKHPVVMFACRVALTVYVRAPRGEEEAAHDVLCPYKDCCNWEHLRWATRIENEADKRHPSRLRLREIPPPLAREAA